jgi:hypothetical protein
MKLTGKSGEEFEVKVPGIPGEDLTTVLIRMYDKLTTEGKEPWNFMPAGDPVLVSE